MLVAALLGGSALAVAACTTPQSPALDEARTAVGKARADANVLSYAQPELKSAEDALAQGQQALEQQKDLDTANSLAYVASRRAATAEELGKARATDQAISQSGEERERTLRMTLEQRLAQLQAQRTSRGLVVGLQGDVLFAVDQATLTIGGMQDVDRVATILRDYPQARVTVEGHTDSTGSDVHNLELSEARANAVRAELISAGVDPSRVTARGMGESYPKAPNDTDAGRQQNRRVEIIVQQPPGAA